MLKVGCARKYNNNNNNTIYYYIHNNIWLPNRYIYIWFRHAR